jgi:predicted ATPase
MTDIPSFGQWLKRRRQALGMTRDDLARRTGYSIGMLRKVESDERIPSRQLVELLAEHLEVEAEELSAFRSYARDDLALERPIPTVHTVVPAPTTSIPHTNLPASPTPLIGRHKEVEELKRLLLRDDVRLVTLTGAGGTGKTRLGLAVASGLIDAFDNGVFFVNLAPLLDANLVVSTIAQTVGLVEAVGRSPLESLSEHLHRKRVLLVLDNFEHLVSAAPQVAELLAASPRLKVLATSRMPLHLRGEHEFPVLPLAVPDVSGLQRSDMDAVSALSAYPAFELFIQRAQAVKPYFALTDDNARAVAEICRRLDGLPLAIELAAVRTKVFPPQALLQRLGSRLAVLTGGARDLPDRQQTLRDAIAWSYDLLDTAEKLLFRRLGVFVGGFTLAAAEAVCNADGMLVLDVVDGVSSLLDKSLLQQVEGGEGEPRFTFLETIREYAVERLAESGEANAVQEQHARFFLDFAETASQSPTDQQMMHWKQLETEHPNLRAALEWSVERNPELALRLSGALALFWDVYGHLYEGLLWLETALAVRTARQPPIAPSIRARALFGAGWLAWRRGDFERATAFGQESLSLYHSLGDKSGMAWSLRSLGNLAIMRGDFDLAQSLHEQSLAYYRELGDKEGVVAVLSNLGSIARGQGDYARAVVLLEESIALDQDLENTLRHYAALAELGAVFLLKGEPERAASHFAEALRRLQQVSLRDVFIIYCLVGAAGVSVARRQAIRAARLFGAADASRTTLGLAQDATFQTMEEQVFAAIRAQLDNTTFAAAWAEGQAMTPEQAVASALEVMATAEPNDNG